jgi:hypothetical protein
MCLYDPRSGFSVLFSGDQLGLLASLLEETRKPDLPVLCPFFLLFFSTAQHTNFFVAFSTCLFRLLWGLITGSQEHRLILGRRVLQMFRSHSDVHSLVLGGEGEPASEENLRRVASVLSVCIDLAVEAAKLELELAVKRSSGAQISRILLCPMFRRLYYVDYILLRGCGPSEYIDSFPVA